MRLVCLVVPQPLEKRIAYSRLAGEAQVLLIFIEDQAAIVEKNAGFIVDTLELVDTVSDTRLICLFRTPIGDHSDVRVHQNVLVQFAAPCLRLSTALFMVAISLNSSPKKLVGQFAILPNESSWSVVRQDP